MRSGKILVAVAVLLLFPILFILYSVFGKKDELPKPAPDPESNAEPVEVPTAGIKVSAGDGVPIINDKGVLIQEVRQTELVAASETFPSIDGELIIKPSKESMYGFEK